MGSEDLKGKIGLDTSDFKTGLATVNREIRVIESGFRAASAGLGDWAKSASGLEMRIGALTKSIELQERVVATLQGEYDRLVTAHGADSIAAQNMAVKLNNATEALNKNKRELGETKGALDEMGDESATTGEKVEDLGKEEDKTREKTDKLGGVMKTAGVLVAGLAAAAVAAAAAVIGIGKSVAGLVLDTAAASDELAEMSVKTGIGVEQLQELGYVGKQVGTDVDTMTGSMARLIRSMGTAREQQGKFDDQLAEGKLEDEIAPIGDAAAAFNQLGISYTDASGNLRSNQVVFGEVIDALGKIPNETERDALAMQLFGKSAQELNPLIKAGSAEIARLAEQAQKTGAVMSEKDVMGMASLQDQLDAFKGSMTGTLGTLAGAFLPGVQGIVGSLQGYMSQLGAVVRGADGDLGKMAAGVGPILGQIVTDIAAQGPKLLEGGIGILQGIITAIVTNLPIILPAVVSLMQRLIQFVVQVAPMLMSAGVQILLALVNGILPQLPMLLEAAIQMIVTLIEGLTEAIPLIMPVIAEVIPKIILTLVENLPLLIEAALQLIMALIDGLIIALPILISYVPEIMTAIKDALILALPMIAAAAVEIITALVDGLTNNQFKLSEKARGLIDNIKRVFTETLPELVRMGGLIVQGVWQGIQAAAGSFAANVRNFFANIIAEAKKALGIRSPSAAFAEIGRNMALGLGEGFDRAFENINRNMVGAVNGFGNGLNGLALTPNPSPGGRGGRGGGTVQVFVNATVGNQVDVYNLANAVANEIQRRG